MADFNMGSGELVAIAGVITALGVLIYQSPTRAWKLLVQSLEARVTALEAQLRDKDKTIDHLESEVRRLRTIRSVLENLLRRHSIDIPLFQPGEHPDIAPERRAPVATVALEVPHHDQEPKP